MSKTYKYTVTWRLTIDHEVEVDEATHLAYSHPATTHRLKYDAQEAIENLSYEQLGELSTTEFDPEALEVTYVEEEDEDCED